MIAQPTEKLDLTLKIISEASQFITSKDLFERVKNKVETRELTPIVNKLHLDGYIEKKILGENDESKLTPPYYCRITFSGLLFIERGGYVKESKTLRLNRIWTKTKTVANICNAILILLIAAAGVYVTIESKEKDKIINQKDLKIDSLIHKLETKKSIKTAGNSGFEQVGL